MNDARGKSFDEGLIDTSKLAKELDFELVFKTRSKCILILTGI